MKTILSKQFDEAIRLDPAWASKLTEPLEITDFCDMQGTEITHLSPLLHFTGKNEYGDSADFKNCFSLRVAEGNFAGFVDFSLSHIEKIGNLTCGKDRGNNSAAFCDCKFLKIAEGNFPGCVDFSRSHIEKIGALTCGSGNSAYFISCHFLKTAEGNFPGFVDFSFSGIEKIENLTCAKNDEGVCLNVMFCPNLTKIPITFNPKEIEAIEDLLKKLKADQLKEASRKHLQTATIEIEI